MKILKRILAVVLILALIAALVMAGFVFYDKKYERRDDTVFSVLQITDVHIQNNERKDKKPFKTITKMVEKTNPDLIVVTGDITSEPENMPAIKTFGEFMEKIGVPWAFTFGNHDAEGESSKQEINDYLETLENCIYERGDKNTDGMGNYYYNVTDGGKTVMSLIMMDSNMYYPDKAVGGYDCFHENQIEWYENAVKSIAKEVNGDESKVVPSLAFFHIPMREYNDAYEQAKKDKSIISGHRFEQVYSSLVDDDMFETMVKLESTKGVFAGHDHMNSYAVEKDGIRLSYGISCDHNLYVVPIRGGKLINIKGDGTFTAQNVYRHRMSNNIIVTKEQ